MVSSSDFSIDPLNPHTLIASLALDVGYQYKFTPTAAFTCDTPGNPAAVWDNDYLLTVVSNCSGDINLSGVVDVDDLLAVINSWGNCLSPPAVCTSDIAPSPCGDDVVNVDDLLVVINGWGVCQGCSGMTDPLESVDDCMNMCATRYVDGSPEWADCVDKCVHGLCEAGIINCDD